jgi:hypothetical protein
MVKPLTAEIAVRELVSHMDRCGGEYGDWYVSMASNPEHALFNYHLVDPRDGQYAYCRCPTFAEAKAAVDHLRNVYRVRTGPIMGSSDAVFVYAYKMMTWTRE